MLPFLNGDAGKIQKQIVTFRGMNFSDRYTDGELADGENLSARRFPYLSTRTQREHLKDYDGATAFLYRNQPIAVVGTDLFYGGKRVATVSSGEKQLVTVNTKLCVFPDQIYYDTKTGETGKLADCVSSKVNTEQFGVTTTDAADCFWLDFLSAKKSDVLLTTGNNTAAASYTVYTYGTNYKSVEKCWDTENQQWDETALAQLETPKTLADNLVGCILLPTDTEKLEFLEGVQEKSYDNGGIYAVITKQVPLTYDSSRTNYFATIYQVGSGAHSFKEVFKSGDAVSITGTRGGVYDVDKVLLDGVEENRLHFVGTAFCVMTEGNNVFTDIVYATQVLDGPLDIGNYYVGLASRFESDGSIHSGRFFSFETDEVLSGKYSVCLSFDWKRCYVLNIETREAKTFSATEHFTGEIWNASLTEQVNRELTSHTYLGELEAPIKPDQKDAAIVFSKPFPELDFVCESENRLWGCSNKEQTIYASALGDPTNFFVYNGLSTDSFAVAVGSEGAFSGCCKYGSSVLFWKETRLHKILGSYPSEYYLYTYETEGVQQGSEKSIQNINEVLYYLGEKGVYTYSGGTPQLISSAFGTRHLTQGVAGSDGEIYYLSAKDGENTVLFSYQTASGIWLKEDDTRAVSFSRCGNRLYLLSDEGQVWQIHTDKAEESLEWNARFTPLYGSAAGRKQFFKLLLRVEIPPTAWMKVALRYDDGLWREVRKIPGKIADSIPICLPLQRCDKLEICFSGRGPCTVKSMILEYKVGSDR